LEVSRSRFFRKIGRLDYVIKQVDAQVFVCVAAESVVFQLLFSPVRCQERSWVVGCSRRYQQEQNGEHVWQRKKQLEWDCHSRSRDNNLAHSKGLHSELQGVYESEGDRRE
jgi:hypothetical protein